MRPVLPAIISAGEAVLSIRLNRRLRKRIREQARKAAEKFYGTAGDEKACKICGTKEKVQYHHDDYSKVLDVNRLCPLHHSERQITLRNEERDPYRNTPARSLMINGYYDWKA